MTAFHRINIFLTIAALMLPGCATTGTPPPRCGYESKDIKDVYFKNMNDREVVDLFKEIYNRKVEGQEDAIAKDITVSAFIKAMESMRSDVIKNSGVLDSNHREISFKKWTDDDLVNVYRSITIKIEKEKESELSEYEKQSSLYWAVSAPKKEEKPEEVLTGKEQLDSLEVMRFTALYALGGEISRRDIADGKWTVFNNTVTTTTTVAVQLAVLLGAFLI